MLIPKFMYGTYKEVKKESKKIVKNIIKGEKVEDLLEKEFVNTSDYECGIIMDGPSRLVGGENHFHIYVFLVSLYDDVPKKIGEIEFNRYYYYLLETEWGLLSLLSGMGNTTQMIFRDRSKHLPFLKACLKNWDNFMKLGLRFSLSTPPYYNIWDIHTNLMMVLARNGVSHEDLPEPFGIVPFNKNLKVIVDKYDLLDKMKEI